MSEMKRYISFGCRQLELAGSDRDVWSKRMIARFGVKILPQLPEIREWSIILHSRSRGPVTLRKNCWEYMDCGKEAGGRHVTTHGTCPASTETSLHAIHGGTNAGRACWTVSGTLCRSGGPDALEKKRDLCASCAFYRSILEEEPHHLIVSDETLLMLLP